MSRDKGESATARSDTHPRHPRGMAATDRNPADLGRPKRPGSASWSPRIAQRPAARMTPTVTESVPATGLSAGHGGGTTTACPPSRTTGILRNATRRRDAGGRGGVAGVKGFEGIRLRLSDGYDAYARLWSPSDTPRGAVLYLHGIQSHGQWFEASAARLAEAGFMVLLPDRRGSGRNTADRGHAPSAARLIRDVAEAMSELHVRSGLPCCTLLGVSWGGKLALAAARECSRRVEHIVLVAPGLFPLVDLPWSTKAAVAAAALVAPRRTFPIPLRDPALFTANPDRRAFIAADPLALHRVTAAFLLASRRLDRLAAGVGRAIEPRPLSLLLAEHDRIIDNRRTLDFIRDLRWPHEVRLYPGAHHTLEFEPDPQPFFDDLAARLVRPPAAERGAADTASEERGRQAAQSASASSGRG